MNLLKTALGRNGATLVNITMLHCYMIQCDVICLFFLMFRYLSIFDVCRCQAAAGSKAEPDAVVSTVDVTCDM